MSIDPAEYRERQRSFATKLAEAGLAGAVVVSRGGGTFDRHADVLYLTGHYQPYVYLPEMAPRWSGRSHVAFVMTSSSDGVLCVSVPGEYGHEPLGIDDIRCTGRFATTITDALRDLGLANGSLGMVGLDVLPANLWLELTGSLPAIRFEPADELLADLRRVKSAPEQDLIRAAAAMGRRAVTAFLEALAPGVTEAEAAASAVASVVRDGGGVYLAAVSSGQWTWSYTTTPMPGFGTRRLEDRDLVRFDLVSILGGYLSDFGRTTVVGSPSSEQRRLLGVLHEGLDAAITACRPGVPVREVVAAGDAALQALGVALSPEDGEAVLRAAYPPHWGHGLGLGWERPWLIETEDLLLEPGMFLAVERAVEARGVGTAAAEQNLLVLPDGIEILTSGPAGRWT